MDLKAYGTGSPRVRRRDRRGLYPHGQARQARRGVRAEEPRQLERLPSAFFSVSLAAHGDTEEAEGYVEEFEQETGWRPAKVALFGGALLYTQYGFVKRHLMKRIAGDKPGHLGHRHLARLRLHRVGRGEAVRRGLPGRARRRSGQDDGLAGRWSKPARAGVAGSEQRTFGLLGVGPWAVPPSCQFGGWSIAGSEQANWRQA